MSLALALPAAALVTSPLLARVLGVDGRGAMSTVLAPAGLLSLIATIGIPEATSYFIARSRAHGRDLFLRGAVAVAVSGGVGVGVLFLLSNLLMVNAVEWRWLYLVVAATLPLSLLLSLLRGTAQGLQQFSLPNYERAVAIAVRIVALFGLAALNLLTVPTAVAVAWGAGLVGLVVYVPMLVRVARGPRVRSPARLIQYGAKVWTGTASGVVVLRLDQVLLAVLAGTHDLGLYVVAAAVAEIPQTAVGALRQVIAAQTAHGLAAQQVGALSRKSVLLAVLASAVGILIIPIALPLLFGREFAGAVSVTQVLLLASIPLAAKEVAAAGLMGSGRAGLVSVGQLMGLVVTVVATGLLVPLFGAFGAAVASLLAYSVLACVIVVACSRVMRISIRKMVLIEAADIRYLLRVR